MLAWIDTETTGLDPQTRVMQTADGRVVTPASRLLEVACIVTDDDLCEVARYQAVTDEAKFTDYTKVDAVVREMHHKNGLWGDSIACGKSLATIDEELMRFLLDHAVVVPPPRVDAAGANVQDPPVKPPLAGSTVSFDRGFLDAYLPLAARQLHYRNLDVTSLNEMARRRWPTAYEKRPKQVAAVEHRAMPDIVDSLLVARYYGNQLGHANTCAAAGAAYATGRIYGKDTADARAMLEIVTTECADGRWQKKADAT